MKKTDIAQIHKERTTVITQQPRKQDYGTTSKPKPLTTSSWNKPKNTENKKTSTTCNSAYCCSKINYKNQ